MTNKIFKQSKHKLYKLLNTKHRKTIFLCSMFFLNPLFSMTQFYPDSITKYTFINYEENKFVLPKNTSTYNLLFDKFSALTLQGKENISIVHIGDSHIQADFFPSAFRRALQSYFQNSISGRGLIFPYETAKTNNPQNYKVETQGKWEATRNVEPILKCELGITGIAVITEDDKASISINIADSLDYAAEQIMVFHSQKNTCFVPQITTPKPIEKQVNKELGYTLFKFKKPTDSIVLEVERTDAMQTHFVLQGVNFISSQEGIIYHTCGLNGATFKSFLRCQCFSQHLSALQADWIIVSLGTNDVYVPYFNEKSFAQYIDQMIAKIKKTSPRAAILFTTPGDHLLLQQKINEHTAKAIKIIKEKAEEYEFAYWDLHKIMGGRGAIYAWFDAEMAHTDFLHYTKKGYQYQGIMLFNAFLRTYNSFVKNK